MTIGHSATSIWALSACAAVALSGCQAPANARPAAAAAEAAAGQPDEAAVEKLLTYAQNQNSTGLLVIQDNVTLVARNWKPPADPGFALFQYGLTSEGELLEDVASQQKSFVAVLVGIACDKGLLRVDDPVTQYLGAGWSKASPEQEAAITVAHLLAMNSGLNEKLEYAAAPGTRFFYNTPAYAMTKRVVAKAAGRTVEEITASWLTAPLGMAYTQWRTRPTAFGNVGNSSGLVTTPGDTARFGAMILAGGLDREGRRVISESELQKMFTPSPTNPAYGRLWWLNGSDYVVRAGNRKKDGPLIASAPADLVAALGFLDRRLYLVPSRKLVVVRTGAAAPDDNFDEQLWQRLAPVIR